MVANHMAIDPKLFQCQCGYQFHINDWQRLRMLLSGPISVRCPHCQSVMDFMLVHHTVKIGSKPNKDRMEIWKKC